MNKYFVFDIDGTLAKSKNKIHKLNISAINKLHENGSKIIIATGRQPSSSIKIAKKIGCDKYNDYGISFNGGVLWKFENDSINIIYEKKISPEISKEVFEHSINLGISSFAYTDNGVLLSNSPKSITGKFMSKRTKLPIVKYSGEINCSIYKFVTMGKTKKILELKQYLNKKNLSIFDFSYIPGTSNIEICPPNTNKVNGLKEIAKKENIKSENFVYFGDGDNDCESLKWSGHSVAMKNAKNEVKENAKNVTLKNNKKGGVGHYINKVFFDNNK